MTPPLRLGIAGLGTVGASVVALIERQREALTVRCGRSIEVVAVSARSRAKKRGIDLKKLRWVADPVTLATDREIDVFVELIGGEGDPAKAAIAAALAAKNRWSRPTRQYLRVTELHWRRSPEKHVALNFEAAVGGAIPIVKLCARIGRNSLARIYGILNGTCNYILTRMEQEKLSFRSA
jgi:homoserine dehydrogenase